MTKEPELSKGVLLFKGMKIGILQGDFSISLSEDGEASSKCILSTAYNVIPLWLRAAHDHLSKSHLASENIASNWTEDPDRQRELLVQELSPSMQVIVCCGIGLDALYDTLKPYAKISLQDIQAWKKNGTSRAVQIVEVIRRVYKLKGDDLKNFKKCIEGIIKFRDMAVHPSLELKNTCAREDLAVGVDWKFAAFRYLNAERCFTNTISMIVYLFEHKTGSSGVDESISGIIDALVELNVVQRKI